MNEEDRRLLLKIREEVIQMRRLIEDSLYGKEISIKKIEEFLLKNKFITWALALQNNLLSGNWHCETFHRVMFRLSSKYRLKTIKLTTKTGLQERVYFLSDKIDEDTVKISCLRDKLNLKREEDRKLAMKIILRGCNSINEHKINVLEIIKSEFPNFSLDIQEDLMWDFLKICSNFGYIAEKDKYRFTGYIARKKEAV